jgi:hypothetical protein
MSYYWSKDDFCGWVSEAIANWVPIAPRCHSSFELYLSAGPVIVSKMMNMGTCQKSSHSIYAFSYFVMHVVTMDFFKLW